LSAAANLKEEDRSRVDLLFNSSVIQLFFNFKVDDKLAIKDSKKPAWVFVNAWNSKEGEQRWNGIAIGLVA
jgi:hypothetical protein